MRQPRLPALVVALWVATTLGWWAFAFAPLPSAPPAWLTAARAACFGTRPGGLPAAEGWILLVLAPATFLAAIAVLWGREVPAALRAAARTPLGGGLLAVIALAVAVEGVWVARKVQAARATAAWARDGGDDGALPPAYPARFTPAPDFALVDQHGATVSLASLRGRPVVLTFVFAHCQTLCPLVVDSIKRATAGAGPAEVLLVTLDPWRDTPSSLPGLAARWALPGRFHVLSSGAADEVVAVARAWNVPFERDERSGDITHPGLVFLIDREGRLGYTFNTPSSTWIVEGLRRLDRAHARAG